MPVNLAKQLSTYNITERLIDDYNTIIKTLREKNIITSVSVTPATANMYTGDLYGLFLNKLRVPVEAIYPTMKINGYKCSQAYLGDVTEFLILDNSVITDYVRLFKRKSR